VTKNPYSKCDDVSDVTGVRSSDRMLFLGADPMSFMKKYVAELDHVEDVSDLNYSKVYDKIFVRGVELTDELIGHLCCINVGTIILFSENDFMRSKVQGLLESYWHPSCAWDLVSNVGKCLITDASGPQTYKVRSDDVTFN